MRVLARRALALLGMYASGVTQAQTPSPPQEWQFSRGIILDRLYEGTSSKWMAIVGLGAERAPLYDGASAYRTRGGPVLNFRYRDIAFASTGEGLGVNLLSGKQYQAGVSVGYDLGRRVRDDLENLRGLRDIGRAPVIKLFPPMSSHDHFRSFCARIFVKR